MKKAIILFIASAIFGQVTVQGPELQISGTRISHARTDGSIHVPRSFGVPAGYQLTTHGGSGDAYWAAPGGAFVDSARAARKADTANYATVSGRADSARVSGLSDSAKALVRYARTTAVHDTADSVRAYARARISDSLAGYLPLSAGAGKALTGTLHGTSLNFSGWTADAPIAVSMAYSNAYAHAITVVNSALAAGQRLTVDFGQAASTNNQANFGFTYAGAGSTANKITLGLYGNNDLVSIAGTGVMTVRDLGTGFVRASSGALSASALIASEIPNLDASKIVSGTLPDARIASAAVWNAKEPGITAGTTAQYWRGDKTWQTLNTTAVAEGTRLYYTDARARAAISGSAPISYSSSTGVISHLATDGNLHVPATSTTNGGKFLKAGSTAGSIAWASLTYSDLTGTVPTWNQNTTGSAAKWTTGRTLTIGSTGKAVDGSANVSWSLAEIGAFALAGGTLNSGAQIATNRDVTPSASQNANYMQAPIIAQRASNSGTTTVAAVGFHNLGVNAAALYYVPSSDPAQSFFRYNRHTGDIVTIWDSGNLTNLSQLTNGPGYVTNATVANVDVTEHSASNTNFPVVWDNTARSLYHTAAKMWFNPYSGLFAATAIASGSTLSWGGGILQDLVGANQNIALYASGVSTPAITNCSFRAAKNGSNAAINGSQFSGLLVNGEWTVSATSAGLAVTGSAKVSGLAGTGTRMVTAAADGTLGATTWAYDGPWLPLAGGTVTGDVNFNADIVVGRIRTGLYDDFLVSYGSVLLRTDDGTSWADARVQFPSISTQYSFRVDGGAQFNGDVAFTSGPSVGASKQVPSVIHSVVGGILPALGVNEWCWVILDSNGPLSWQVPSGRSVKFYAGGTSITTVTSGNIIPVGTTSMASILYGPTFAGSSVMTLKM